MDYAGPEFLFCIISFDGIEYNMLGNYGSDFTKVFDIYTVGLKPEVEKNKMKNSKTPA